jgi:hypothetical protein
MREESIGGMISDAVKPKNLPSMSLSPLKFHADCHEFEPVPSLWEAGDERPEACHSSSIESDL